MKIAAITKFKHGEIFECLQQLGWSQHDLAVRCGTSDCRIGEVVNLKKRPTQRLANSIQLAFGEAGVFMDVLGQWPESFRGLGRGRRPLMMLQVKEIPEGLLLDQQSVFQLAAPNQVDDETKEFVESMMSEISPKERGVIERRFFDGLALDEVGKEMGVTRERVRQIEGKAIRKMRVHAKKNAMLESNGIKTHK
jgi:transcriptional regulator with XRE-family HTH domain